MNEYYYLSRLSPKCLASSLENVYIILKKVKAPNFFTRDIQTNVVKPLFLKFNPIIKPE